MGLDQNLYEKHYIGQEYLNDKSSFSCTRINNGVEVPIKGNIVYVITDVGYWRKANQIQEWVNTHVGTLDNGVDMTIDGAELLQLREACVAVLADHSLAEDILPTSVGFFFGSDEYDDYYYAQLQDTIDIIDKLELTDDERREFAYNGNY